MTGEVHIFEVYVGETPMSVWLCAACLAVRAKAKAARPPKMLDEPVGFSGRCEDCIRAEQSAPGYATPTVDFLPTSLEAFCPAPGWVADAPIEPWAKPKSGRQRQEAIEPKEAA
jgi:hypothetical protein